MSPQFEIQLIAVIVAIACSLPGVFLVLRGMSMMSDSITHTILLGIVLAFFLTHDLSSPFLIMGATLMGVVTVWLTETLNRTRLLSEDSAIGIVFPLLFSIAIILITRYAGSVHLDTDAVLLGELAFAPFERLIISGVDLGAKSIYKSSVILMLNLAVIVLFFKELKLVTFDSMLAAALGFSPVLVHYCLMTLVSLTAVSAFEAVGSVLVVAFMIGPPVTAYLLTDDLKHMLIISGAIGAVNGILGYQAAAFFDVSIAGSMAVVTGMVFTLAFVLAPRRGLVSALRRRRLQKTQFAQKTLLFHLYNREAGDHGSPEIGIRPEQLHLNWSESFTQSIVASLQKKGCLHFDGCSLKLTEEGRQTSIRNYEELYLQ
ncbi:metal ABC transporter permease [Desulfosporosinus youngiae]|uniref:ABC-type Mn2+/Zn2+ transport system, permease component n=1 Tax=Desulfosporosinus youngiae DSM 17734 TaxID=768710 RepID=H5Y1U8_9FIRM|nr:metal ABC transporter permease [Desulfosporosinus youngiae]EHQ87999.1 ABC-type Mn2+/Zn2+ transport system, permease component [Desulfosporosinus youngiae DSM 17734]